jgi:ribosomal protein S28E/S33
MVALFSRAVIQRTGPYGEALEKQLEPLEGHEYNIIIIREKQRIIDHSHHVH